MVKKRKHLKGFGSDSSSSDSDDAFAAISKKKKPRIGSITDSDNNKPCSTSSSTTTGGGETSSNKRHHHVNVARQAKMDSLLQELQTSKPTDQSITRGDYEYGTIENESYYGGGGGSNLRKKGSYVEPGMEHLTTNLFVGNLDPMTTEEELTDIFRQFGKTLFYFYIISIV